MRLADLLPPTGSDPAEVLDAFATWAEAGGRPLYQHQEDAAFALATGDHVVLATPTGSGKSLVAVAGVALALNRGERAVWTAPIKALVAEKFFDLVELFGAPRVGLATGDASINPDAPVLVCTAEVLANQALATGVAAGVGFACLDEFHYYADRDRGWAWQVPLLELHRCQFLLASATLGDMTAIVDDLETRSGRTCTRVTAVARPTPLLHQWRTTSVADSVSKAVSEGLSPVYVVHATQAAAIERAQALVSLPLTSRPQREAIAEAVGGMRLTSGFGQTLGRLLRNGVGVHHAGMLPRHRRLVERLAAQGLLAAICGTDTLGVGVNIPIRTVLMTALTKFDGTKVRVFTAREFHQLAGRAGRPGFDPDGHVWVQAPDHVVENAKRCAPSHRNASCTTTRPHSSVSSVPAPSR
ncbi:MAG: DEAD/DEAH box helicase [Nocardiopsis sp. BM-2018]|nr:MAG: DEAD/DEAH box helicase [Nocardiopsis sp. BM-2018]